MAAKLFSGGGNASLISALQVSPIASVMLAQQESFFAAAAFSIQHDMSEPVLLTAVFPDQMNLCTVPARVNGFSCVTVSNLCCTGSPRGHDRQAQRID